MKKVITGNSAVSHAVKLARVDVIVAYPITPQTSIVEELAEMHARGELGAAQFMQSESEHSSMSACIGAAMAGARAFTATSSQGLAYMHEMLHWAAGGRLPVVMANVNRSLAPPWTIYTDQQDSLSQRDTGWMQFYCRHNQEVVDTVILAYKVAERVNVPAMVVLDAFVLSHTDEVVDLPDQALVDGFLPPRQAPFRLDPRQPRTFGGMMTPDCWMETRVQLQAAMDEAVAAVDEETRAWAEITGRRLRPLQLHRLEDARVALVAAGTAAETATLAVDRLRDRDVPAGAVGLWMFRPFPVQALREALGNLDTVVVVDRSCSYGHSGIFAQEVRSALYDLPAGPRVVGVVAGLGGREITPEGLERVVGKILAEPPASLVNWMDVKVGASL